MFPPIVTDVPVDAAIGGAPASALSALQRRVAKREMRGTVEQGSISLRLRGVLAHRPYQPVFTGPLVGVLMVTVGFVFFATVNRFVNGLASRLKDILGEAAAESPNKSFERTREG